MTVIPGYRPFSGKFKEGSHIHSQEQRMLPCCVLAVYSAGLPAWGMVPPIIDLPISISKQGDPPKTITRDFFPCDSKLQKVNSVYLVTENFEGQELLAQVLLVFLFL